MGLEHIPTLEQYRIDISHQEMDRIVSELEAWYQTAKSAGAEWLSIEAAESWLTQDLGYEDVEEFREALKGTLEQFLGALPTIQLRRDEQDRPVFKVIPDPPKSEREPFKLTLPITDRKQLWNVLSKAPDARIVIPELEFEISEDSKRKIDSLYNHIAAAIFNLGTHCRTVPMAADVKDKIMDTVIALNMFLDVEKPWTLIVDDPSGLSQFSDMAGVQQERLEDPSAQVAAGQAAPVGATH